MCTLLLLPSTQFLSLHSSHFFSFSISHFFSSFFPHHFSFFCSFHDHLNSGKNCVIIIFATYFCIQILSHHNDADALFLPSLSPFSLLSLSPFRGTTSIASCTLIINERLTVSSPQSLFLCLVFLSPSPSLSFSLPLSLSSSPFPLFTTYVQHSNNFRLLIWLPYYF